MRRPWRESVRALFPVRQILIRDGGRVRCLTLTPARQILLLGVLAAGGLWSVTASVAWLDGVIARTMHESEIARRIADLDGIKASYQAAFHQLDEFHGIFATATCEIADIQNSLTRLAERGLQPSRRGGAPAPWPQLDNDANGCRASNVRSARLAQAATDEPEAVRQRMAQLEADLDRLRASHGAFLTHTANIASLRIGQLERALKSVGIDSRTLASAAPQDKADRHRFGRGGPFIAAPPESGLNSADLAPVALFNARARRLDGLNGAVRALPLAAPLLDYELTSPFGARNDPINFMTGIHEGIDLGAPEGTPVMATGEGIVVWAGPRDRYGNMVEIDHGMGLHTRYAHLSRVLVRADQKVGRGTPIGLLGSTGRTTGPHLHYEVRMSDQAINPMKFILAGRDVLKVQ